jgi:hypothetical protein
MDFIEARKIASSNMQIGTFGRGQQKIPALIPADKGIVFYVDENNKNLIYNQIQYSLLTVLQQLEIGAIEIMILNFTIERT